MFSTNNADKPKLRILHLEDSETDCELVRAILCDDGINCELVRLESRADFVRELENRNFDVIFADSALPEFSGLRALELARQHVPETPFIFVSGTMEEDAAIELLRNGATDYVLKHRLSRLVPAVRRALAEAEERTRNHEMEQRLRQAERLEAIGTLAGGIAHDFNNILTIIKGHSSLLPIESEHPDRVREISATIDRATRRGTELIAQMLAIARKGDCAFVFTDANQRVREITSMLREAMSRNITFELQLTEDLPEIFADPGQMERAIVNLATNARDAMPDGGTILFATSQVARAQVPSHLPEGTERYLCLRVADTGMGMDQATLLRVFEPFFTTKSKGKGTGLGMSVVYGLMQSHNGFIDVQSELGKGTSVSLFFPIPTVAAPKKIELVAENLGTGVGTESLLIVDDERDVRSFLEAVLKAHGYRVFSAGDAEEALEILSRQSAEIQLVFSDVGLPKLDGYGLSRLAKSLHPHLKTILASGYVDAAVKARMAEYDTDGFIPKPYEVKVLLQSIRAVLDKDAGHRLAEPS